MINKTRKNVLKRVYSAANLYKHMTRTNNDRKSPQIVNCIYNINPNFLYKNTIAIPSKWMYNNTYIYMKGGYYYNARYPDIIISNNDYLRADNIIKQLNITSSTYDDILVKYIYTIFDIYKLTSTDYRYSFVQPWSLIKRKNDKIYKSLTRSYDVSPFISGTTCFTRKMLKCKNNTECNKKKKKYPRTLTNITALPYLIGDCREVAWFTGFMYNAASMYLNEKCVYHICYSTLCMFDEKHSKLTYIMDHVFVIKETENKLIAIDPYASKKGPNTFYTHNTPITIIKLNNINKLKNRLVFKVGYIYMNGKKTNTLIAIPKIYNGNIELINKPDNITDEEKQVLLMNKPILYKEGRAWINHAEFCEQ